MSEAIEISTNGEYSFAEDFNKLIQELEVIACSKNPDYAEGLEDGFSDVKPYFDVGGEIRTELIFNIEHVREAHRPGIHGPVISTSYLVGGTVSRFDVVFDALPKPMQEHLIESGHIEDETGENVWEAHLRSEDAEIMVQYKYSTTVVTDGRLIPSQELIIYIDDAEYPMPIDRPKGSGIGLESEEQRDGVGEIDMSGFEIDPELSLLAEALGKEIAYEHDKLRVLELFFENIDMIKFISNGHRLNMMRNTLRLMYEDA